MVQVIETGNPQGKLSEMLGMSLGQGIGNGLNTFFANRSLESVMKDKSLKNAPQSKKMEALRSALSPYGEKGQEIFKQRMQIEEQEKQENIRNNLSKAFGYLQKNANIPESVLESLPEDVQLKLGDFSRSNRVAGGLYDTMVAAGVPEEIAKNQSDIIRSSEKGTGQTYAIQGANDLINRFREVPKSEPFNQNVGSGKFSKLNPKFEFPVPEKTEGLTLKERADVKKENTQNNLKEYNENRNRKRNLEEDKFSFQKLRQLSPKISSGISKWNINPLNGEIIFPAEATPEERQFGKLIVRQLRNAKDTYGARVTNFDAAKYLEGFPGLGDSPEAREAILKDLQLINQLNLLHADAMDEVYRTYKPGEISLQQAEQIGDDISKEQTEKLWNQFIQPNDSFSDLPSAQQYRDRIIKNEETGESFRSDGQKWNKV
jgi:hypothetical protein